LEVTGLESFNPAFTMVFATGMTPDAPNTIVNVGALPGVRVKIPFDLSNLDSNKMFHARTPGVLKKIVLGRGVKPEEVTAFVFAMKNCFKAQRFILHDLYLTDTEPDYIISHEPIVDKLGQLNTRNWPGKTASEAEMAAALQGELKQCSPNPAYPNRSRYGGDLSVRWEATGFFRTHYDGKRWYLVDPEGYRFVSTGLDCCRADDMGYVTGIEMLYSELPDKEAFREAYSNQAEKHDHTKDDALYVSYGIANLIRAFGADWFASWQRLTKQRLIDWCFNTIGNWSDADFIRNARLPYVWPMQDFPLTKTRIFRDFPDVYSIEYAENCAEFAKQLEAFKSDPCMIGYFMRNEPEWAFVQNLFIAEKVLENPADTACKRMIITGLREKYGDIETLNCAWGEAYTSFDEIKSFNEKGKADAVHFSKQLIRKYAEVPGKACKAVDTEHLNLGMRYSMLTDPILLEGHENFDVYSLNGYQENPYEEVQKAGELTGKPVIIGEFHFGAIDVGLLAAGVSSVATQRDRGLAYRQYYEEAMNSPYFVGAHYFILNDQAVLGRFDGENMQIGMVDVCQKPYKDFAKEVTKTNSDIYAIADGKRSVPATTVRRIPRLMGF
jgi:hypothetical protein